jgi:hypothetical protein
MSIETSNEPSQPIEHHHHDHAVEIVVDGVTVTSPSHHLTGLQIRELGAPERIHGFRTEIASGHVRVIGDNEEIDLHEHEHFRTVIEIYLDGDLVLTRSKILTGRQIRELGSADRVDGFETQEVDDCGKKKRTIGDTEQVEIHEHERFREVPNHGGPGGA